MAGSSRFRDEFAAALDERVPVALELLDAALAAGKDVRPDVKCPGCKRNFRPRIKVIDAKTRLEALKVLADYGHGRPGTAAPEAASEGVVFYRVVTPEDENLRDFSELVRVLHSSGVELPAAARAIVDRFVQAGPVAAGSE